MILEYVSAPTRSTLRIGSDEKKIKHTLSQNLTKGHENGIRLELSDQYSNNHPTSFPLSVQSTVNRSSIDEVKNKVKK